MAPDDDNLMEVLVMDFEKLADAQNECEWVQELRTKKDPNRINIALRDSHKKLLVDITDEEQAYSLAPQHEAESFRGGPRILTLQLMAHGV